MCMCTMYSYTDFSKEGQIILKCIATPLYYTEGGYV